MLTPEYELILRELYEVEFLCRNMTFVGDVKWHFVILGDLKELNNYKFEPIGIVMVDSCGFQEMPETQDGNIMIIPRHYTFLAPETEQDDPFQYIYDENGDIKLVEKREVVSWFDYPYPMQFNKVNSGDSLIVKVAIPLPKFRCKTPSLIRVINWSKYHA